MKNTLSKRLGLVGIVLSSALGLGSLGCVPEGNNQSRNSKNYSVEQKTEEYNNDELPALVPVKPIPKGDGWVSASENANLNEKLIVYDLSNGSYVITDQGKESCEIFGYIDLENQENFLKGESYEEGREGSVKVDANGKVRYMLPPGSYSIWTEKKGRVKEFKSKNPLDVIELGYDVSDEEEKEQSGKEDEMKYFQIHNADGSIEYREGFVPNFKDASLDEIRKNTSLMYKQKNKKFTDEKQPYSSTLVIKEENPEGDVIKAVQPEPYESIEDALKRPEVEEYFLPRERGKKEYKTIFKEHIIPNRKYKAIPKERVIPRDREYR